MSKQRNNIKTVARGVFEIKVSLRRPNGQRVYRRRTVRGTHKEAVAVRDLLKQELHEKLYGKPVLGMTLMVYARQWLEVRTPRLRPSTIRKYVNDLENHILPVIGDRPLSELRPSEVQSMLDRDKGAPSSKKNRLSVLRIMSKDAIADRLIDFDFCLRVSVAMLPVYTDEEPNLLTAEQLATLLVCVKGDWLDAVYLMAFTGLRWCEVAGLMWEDIDFERALVRIRRANVKGEIGPPKTQYSRRTVGLVDVLVDRLRDRRQRMLLAQHPGLRKGWVFPKPNGDHYTGCPMHKVLKRGCEAAGITIRFTVHGLRRTYNDLARRSVDALIVRSVVGHSSEQMTEHYSRVTVAEKRAASQAVLSAVQASASKPTPSQADTVHLGAPVGAPDVLEAPIQDRKDE